MYIIESDAANTQRLQKNSKNSDYSLKTLEILDKLLRKINPYVQSYKMMYEVECAQNNKKKSGTPQLDIRMIYTRDSTHDKKRYNIAACNEVAVIFVADDGDPPIERDVTVFLRNSENFCTLNILSKHVDGMVYPLILPSGGFG